MNFPSDICDPTNIRFSLAHQFGDSMTSMTLSLLLNSCENSIYIAKYTYLSDHQTPYIYPMHWIKSKCNKEYCIAGKYGGGKVKQIW